MDPGGWPRSVHTRGSPRSWSGAPTGVEGVILLASEARDDRTFYRGGDRPHGWGGFRPLPSLRRAGPLPVGRAVPTGSSGGRPTQFPSPDSLRPLAGRFTILIPGFGDGLQESGPQRARALRCASEATPEVPCRPRPRVAAVGNLPSAHKPPDEPPGGPGRRPAQGTD